MATLLDQSEAGTTPRGQIVALPNGADHQPASPLMMLVNAIDRGTDPSKLGELIALVNTERARIALEAFTVAMNEAQAAMPCIVRDGVNPFLKTKYAKLETVNSQVKPVAAAHGFSLSFSESDSPKGTDWIRVVCDISHTGGHTRQRYLDMPLDGAGMKGGQNKSGPQALGATLTYARRYLTLLIFNITVADEDLDGAVGESLACISEQDVLDIEDLIRDKAVNLPRFIDWLREGRMCVGEASIKTISAKHLPKIIKTLQTKKGPGDK